MDPAELRLPEWVVPSRWEVRDALLLGVALGADDHGGVIPDGELVYARTVAVTCSWVAGAGPAPLTGSPARVGLARAEVVAELRTDPPGALGVAARSGAYDTGLWLLGTVPGDTDPRPAPFDLPPRHLDGTLITAQEMHDHLVAHDPRGVTSRRWRRDALARLREEEAGWRETAELIERTARRLAGPAARSA